MARVWRVSGRGGTGGNEFVCCFWSGLDRARLALDMLVRRELEVWGRARRMWFGQGESRGCPRLGRGPWEVSGAAAGHTEVPCLAGAEGVGQGLADWKAIR